MITEKKRQEINRNWLPLVLKYFESRVKTIVGGLKAVDVIGTAASIVDKIMNEFTFVNSK